MSIPAQASTSPSPFFPRGLPTRRRPSTAPLSSDPSDVLRRSSGAWFWGESSHLQSLEKNLLLAARHQITSLVVGETGTGKELVAHALHDMRRKLWDLNEVEAPFVAVNCGAIPEALAESLLFGHERGAFTSARERQYGKFELARKGTLFLDEIQTLSPQVQVKLLRVLQSRDLDRLGSSKSAKVECQIVAASNEPLELLVEKGSFRRDLYYRINVCPLHLPALRQRQDELERFVSGLLGRICDQHRLKVTGLSPEAWQALRDYSWPGNLRELEHCLLFAALRAEAGQIEFGDLPPSLTGSLENFLKEGSWR